MKNHMEIYEFVELDPVAKNTFIYFSEFVK